MTATIPHPGALARLAPAPAPVVARSDAVGVAPPRLVGVISNPLSHHNRASADDAPARAGMLSAAPSTRGELRETLVGYAARGVDLLVIDGGDGTIRDVLTCGAGAWGSAWPRLAILPTGKTNALGVDLGVPAGWTLDEALAAAARGRTAFRTPIEVTSRSDDQLALRGFLFGAGAFVDATALAQHTHRAGAFDGLAVGLALGWSVARTLFGGANGQWRAGTRMSVRFDPDAQGLHDASIGSEGRRYVMLASTLQRLPLGLKPFGRLRPGLKTLVIDAPPQRLVASVPALLRGREDLRLEQRGYHRVDAQWIEVELEAGFILDGEIFPGGAYRLAKTTPLTFVTP